MDERTLFLAWQDVDDTLLWFPIGRLDANLTKPRYRFRYIRGAERAKVEAGFPLLLEFPDIGRDYQDDDLFPLFQNRVINRAKSDREHRLKSMDLDQTADPIDILARSGGRRVTDDYRVFPKLVKGPDGLFLCRFFLHGWRHVAEAKKRLNALQAGEELYLDLDRTNPLDELAVQIQTTDRHRIGWMPRYLVHDLAKAMSGEPSNYPAKVVRVNNWPSASPRYPAPSYERVLIEMRGRWENHEPMSSKDYQLCTGDA